MSQRKELNKAIFLTALRLASGNRDLAKEIIQNEISEITNGLQITIGDELSGPGIRALSDDNAKVLQSRLNKNIKTQNHFVSITNPSNADGCVSGNLSQPPATANIAQRKAIIKITKYTLHWSPEATFSYCLETCPALRNRLNIFEIKRSKLSALYNALSVSQASKIIKRLDQLIKKNGKQKS